MNDFASDVYKEPWYLRVSEEYNLFCKKVDEKLDKQHQQLKACKKRTELASKLKAEHKLKEELTQKLNELSKRGTNLGRVCASFESRLTIADNDQNRLDNAKETYQLAKELTGIRFDFSAPPNVAKGYIKNEARRLLQPFDVQPVDSDTLWSLVQSTGDPTWPHDKENQPLN